MFWFYRANVYQNCDFKKLCPDILKICRFLRFFLWNTKFLRTFALPFKRWVFHRTNGAKYVERFVCLQPLEKMLKS